MTQKKEETKTVSKNRKEREGKVISTKMQKTIVVEVTRRVPHPKFKKIIQISKRLYAHDEEGKAAEGDKVRIAETRPMSRLKRWELIQILKN
jgi:small subunit ribosomal protein S17